MLGKQKTSGNVCISVIFLKQKIWTLGEVSRVHKLLMFSLSTVFIHLQKTSRDARQITNIAGGERDLNLQSILNNLQDLYSWIYL